MTQILFFLAEYAEECLVLLCSLILILLLVTLHRMKRITKLIQEIAGNTNDAGEGNVRRERKEENNSVSVKKGGREQDAAGGILTAEENAELLSEVLEEIFP